LNIEDRAHGTHGKQGNLAAKVPAGHPEKAKAREEKKILGAPPFGRGLIHQTRKMNPLYRA